MAIDPITWIIVAAISGSVAGFALGYFWDEIKAWATRAIGYILDAINEAIEVTSDAVLKLVKQGYRYYKKAEAYVMNIRTGRTRIESRQEEIRESEIPQEIQDQLRYKAELKLLQSST